MAFFVGDCKMVELLLAKGAYVDPVASCGTPLHFAATQGQDGTMKILLHHNADVSFYILCLIYMNLVQLFVLCTST
jgi:ankyrin repeat protein